MGFNKEGSSFFKELLWELIGVIVEVFEKVKFMNSSKISFDSVFPIKYKGTKINKEIKERKRNKNAVIL